MTELIYVHEIFR